MRLKQPKIITVSKTNLPTYTLTLRWRLAFWTGGMFVVLCLGLLVFVNLTAGSNRAGQLQVASLVGFFLVTLVGGAGAYWLAGVALRPLREVSLAAKSITADTLATRLAFSGPEDELKELAQAFDAMLDRLEGAFAEQRRFTADAAHELRTPLATLRTNLEVISTDEGATLADFHSLTATLDRGLARLEKLVADLLTLVTEGELAFELVSIGPLLEEVVTSLVPLAKSYQIELELDDQSTSNVRGDSFRLMQVCTNLIENAIRYNRTGGKVVIKAFDLEGAVMVRIQDSGVGIAQAEQPFIFERFYRVDRSRTRHKGGAGLGLAIVKHIVSEHGGEVCLLHSSPEGSTFQLKLPLVPAISQPQSLRQTDVNHSIG